ncbi:MAG: hypothetical protein U1F15_03400 [Burkholderiales bacterium]
MTRAHPVLRRFGAFALAAVAHVAAAATNVGGPITVGTTWTLANAPYTATADVTIDAGAVLTIEPGVTVFMNPGTNLIVKNGALAAQGSQALPIVVTSYRDVPNPNPLPAPGDWGQLQFQAGTIAASTALDHVHVKYGAGIAITGASPTLNRVSSLNHLGAAIAIDLASSPVGQGLVATGNTINGIAVPAGDITGSVTWGLTGIPYVVAQGVVGVGAPQVPLSIAVPADLLVTPGLTVNLPITLSAPAPAGGVSVALQSANAAVATVPSPAGIAAGASTANATVTGVAPGSTTITASAAGYAPGVATVTVAAITLDIQPSGTINVPQGVAQSYAVKLSQPAPTGGVVVSVASNDAAKAAVSPANVTIAQGQTVSASTFAVQGVATGVTTLTLTSPGLAAKTVNVNVLGQGSVVFNYGAVVLGKSLEIASGVSNYQVKLQAGGVPFASPVPVTVTLASGDPAKVAVPANVVIPAGSGAANLQLRGVDVTGAPVAITATAPGYQAPAPLDATVVAPPLAFANLDGARVTTGPRDGFTLNWQVPDAHNPLQTAPADTTIDLAITNASPPGIVAGFFNASSGGSAIAQLVIPANQNASPGAYVETPSAAGSYTVTASVPGLTTSTSAVQTVTSPALQLPPAITIGAGLTSFGNAVQVTRTGDLSSALSVSLSCAPIAICTVPSSVTIAATAASASVPVTGVANGVATLVASSAGYTPASGAVTTETPSFASSASGNPTTIGGTINVTFRHGGNGQVPAFSPTDVVIALASSAPAVASVPASVTIPAGATSAPAVPLVGLAPGTVSVTATSPGYQASGAGVFTIIDNRLQLAPTTSLVGVGQTLAMTVSVADPAPAGGIPVTLSSSNAGFVSVPASVTIPAFATSAGFVATGVATGTATITAHAGGYIDATSSVTASSGALSLPNNPFVSRFQVLSLPITLTTPAPAGGVTVNVGIANAAVATAQASVSVPAGASIAHVDVTGVAVGTTTLTVSAPGYSGASTTIFVGSIAITLSPGGSIAIPQGVAQDYRVVLSSYASTGNGFTVDVNSADPGIVSVSPSSVTLPYTVTVSPLPVTITGVAKGATTITASSPGLADVVLDVEVLDAGNLRFAEATTVIGKGMVSPSGGQVLLYAGANPYTSPVPVTVTLADNDPTRVGVPATAPVPPSYAYALFDISGLDFTGTPASIVASAPGYGTSATPLQVSVVPPDLQLEFLDGSRILAGGRDQFSVWMAPPATATLGQVLMAPVVVDLSITNQNPAGIVGAIFDQATGGSAITQVTLPAGGQQVQRFVGQPAAAGTYTITGNAAGLVTRVSPVQTVFAQGELVFSQTSVAVGKGLTLPGLVVMRQLGGQPFVSDDPVTVTLVNPDPASLSVPATVTIPKGQAGMSFAISGQALTALPVQIDATAAGYASPVAKLGVSVVAPQIQVNELDTVRTLGSARDLFQVNWYVQENPSGPYQMSTVDTDIAITVTDQTPSGIVAGIYDQSSGGTLITALKIPAGSSRASKDGYVGIPTAAVGSYTITAAAAGIATAVSPLQTVTNATPALVFSTPDTVTLGLGMASIDDSSLAFYRTIQGFSFYGADPVTITVVTDNPGIASFPDTVTIEAELPLATVSMAGLAVGSMKLTATAPGYVSPPPVSVSVVTPQLQFQFNEVPPALAVNGLLDFYVNVVVPNGNPQIQYVTGEAVALALSTTDPNVAALTIGFAYVMPGQNQAFVQAMGIAPGTFRIQADAQSGGANGASVLSDPITVTP